MGHQELKNKIARLKDYTIKLSNYTSLDSGNILSNEDKLLAMERVFLLMVDEATDINATIAYQLGGNIADSYKSTFYELQELKVIDLELAEKIAESAKIRNQLIHDYETLQKKTLLRRLRNFTPYTRNISKF